MPTIKLVDPDSAAVEEITLREEVFAVEPKPHLLQEVVRAQLNARRQGTASTKTRGELAFSRRKLYRQKGTGRARRGHLSSPLLRKGGTVFGPKPRSYRIKVNRKVRKSALRMALSAKLAEGKLSVIKPFELEKPCTREAAQRIRAITEGESALVVTVEDQRNLVLSLRNLPEIKTTPVAGINVYDLLRYERLVIMQPAVAAIEEVLAP
jgi:large subunit ribosomal protein L4